MNKTFLLMLLLPLLTVTGKAQTHDMQPADSIAVFRFVPQKDMFYIPYGGNDTQLNRLYNLVEQYKTQITSGSMPVYVDGYCAFGEDATANFKMAVVRSNRVKSELIIHKGLAEENFVTKNHATAYEGHKDMVVVTLRIPAESKPQLAPVAEQKQEPRPEPKPEPAPEPKPQPKSEPVTVVREEVEIIKAPDPWHDRYCFAVRTNLLYDAFLVPTLGVEWRFHAGWGVKVDAGWSGWDNEHGKVQKLWMVNPEVRRYMGSAKRFYLGLGATIGEYNIYQGMIGNLISDDTGYQGNMYGGGLTVGYQARLGKCLSLDFNLGLGYAQFSYDSFTIINDTRVHKATDQTKEWFGPTQAGVSLVWRLGGK